MSIAALNIPTLETERLVLRAHCEADFEPMLADWQDPAVLHYIHAQPLTRQDAWGRFLKNIGSWAVQGLGMWAVAEKATGRYAGTLGIFDIRRELTPSVAGMLEAGWMVSARCHGKGYATEAMRAGLAWADVAFGYRAMFCIVSPGNTASIRVAEKCGFSRWYEAELDDGSALLMHRPPGAKR